MSEKDPRVKYKGIPPLLVRRRDFLPAVPIWKDQTVYIIGGGPSFLPEYAERLRGHNVIGCNESYALGGDIVTFCHFLDLIWWNLHKDKAVDYSGTFTTCNDLILDKGVRVFRSKPSGIEFKKRDTISHNRNTGLSAINLAIHFGANKIILLGFDMGGGGVGSGHWYERDKDTNNSSLRMHRKAAFDVYEDIEEHGGIEVINASPDSKLVYWPKVSPEDILP